MRLISSKTLELEEFIGKKFPNYVILSHTWGDQEVTFDDMQGSHVKKMKGFAKIEKYCAQAARDGYGYVWVDTCCIDKSSSAELSEALNSMYKWYENADICYAYLEDIVMTYTRRDILYPQIQSSKCFTRGWTLQELIAPKKLEFYDMNWVDIGTKQGRKDELSKITGIDLEVLESGKPWKCNVAQRMSWVAERITTREEDIAYCLMRLFNVNMLLLYGEGEHKAFRRLQDEILKEAEDYTLFAWSVPSLLPLGLVSGLIARSPRYFKTADFWGRWRFADLRISSPAKFSREVNMSQQELQHDPPYTTSRGLRICLPMGAITNTEYWACLFCPREQNGELLWPCVRLAQVEDEQHVYQRLNYNMLAFITTKEVQNFKFTIISVRFAPSVGSQWASRIGLSRFDQPILRSLCDIKLFPDPLLELSIGEAYPSLPEDWWFLHYNQFMIRSGNKCALEFQGTKSEVFYIAVAISMHRPSCKIFLPVKEQDKLSNITDILSQMGKLDRDILRLPSGNLVHTILKTHTNHGPTNNLSLHVYLRSGNYHEESRN